MNYKPYTVVLGKNLNLAYVLDYIRMQYDLGFTLRIPYLAYNLKLMSVINELNVENGVPYTNQLEVFLPFNNVDKKMFFTNMRNSDIEVYKSYKDFLNANHYYIPFFYSDSSLMKEEVMMNLVKPRLQYDILYKDIKDKVVCSYNLLKNNGIESDHVLLLGDDDQSRRLEYNVDVKIVNLTKSIASNLNIEIRTILKDGRLIRYE